MKVFPPTTTRFRPAWAVAFLVVSGCAPQVDDQAIINTIRKTDPEVVRLVDFFPRCTPSLDKVLPGKQQLPDPFSQKRIFSIRGGGREDYTIRMARGLTVHSDGIAFELLGTKWSYRLEFAEDVAVSLTEREFDALLTSGGNLGSLKPYGKDFSLSPMDERKVIDHVREAYSPAHVLHDAFPDAWTKVFKNRYEQTGNFVSVARLDGGNELSVQCEIQVAADGIGVELVEQPSGQVARLSLYLAQGSESMTLDRGKLGGGGGTRDLDATMDGGKSMILEPEKFDRILKEKGAPAVIQQVWSQRFSEPVNP
jgi:hypothetical protein